MPLDLQQVWEGGSRDDREPGDRPLTGNQLVRRWVDGRGVMGLLKYAAGSAAIVALACCHSAARAQSNSDQLPPVVVNPDSPPKPARQIRQRSRSPQAGPSTAGRECPSSIDPTARRGGGDCRQRTRAHQPHRQLDQRGQRRDTRDQQSRLAGRRVANGSRPRRQRERWTGFDDEHPAARRQYRPDAGDDRRHPDQRSRPRRAAISISRCLRRAPSSGSRC